MCLSSVIVVDRVDPLAAPVPIEEQVARPYALGTAELVPATDLRFERTEPLSLFFFVYNPGLDGRGEPDIGIRYLISDPFGTRSIVLGETAAQMLRDRSPAGLDGTARRELPVFHTLPLGSLPPGEHRLDIEVTDRTAGETVRQGVTFFVTGPP